MTNPWKDLPNTPPYVLDCDRRTVDEFNERYANTPEFMLQTHLYPEPFFGNVWSQVFVLNLNPGYSPADDDWHRNPSFAESIRQNLAHTKAAYPHYYLDPKFCQSPGARWWAGKCRWLIRDCGIQSVAKNLFCAELIPYHSKKYRQMPNFISANGLVDSSAYTADLVRQAMDEGKAIVAMRSFNAWCRLIPKLARYSNLHRLNSPQNVSLSPKNLPRYNDLVAALAD